MKKINLVREIGARSIPRLLLVMGLISSVAVTEAVPIANTDSNTQVKPTRGMFLVSNPKTPIHHVVVIIGENHSFNNVFGTYKPIGNNKVKNLLSQKIVTQNGLPGSQVKKAQQWQAIDTTKNPGHYSIKPTLTAPYKTLPQPNNTYVNPACNGGQLLNTPDNRFPSNLANSPYQITKYVPYFQPSTNPSCQTGAYVGDPIHRFYQMNQQVNGGKNKLWTWVHQTAGYGNGTLKPIHQGALEMGYYNMAAGDVPTLKFIADHYSMSDNYHQAIMGGTGANHIAIGDANVAVYRNKKGQLAKPPSNQIENPNPTPGTNNYYTQDGYQGGSYSQCANPTAPGVGSIDRFLGSLPYTTFKNGDCKPGAYYLLNNYNPGYNPNGTLANTTINPYTVPPQTFPTIADKLQSHKISWGYFGQGWNNGNPTPLYCGICDPFQYATSVMTNPAKRANLQGLSQFEADVSKGKLPGVSFVKPAAPNDGHPGYSTLASFENFTARVVDNIIAQPKLFKHTAIFVTFDEGGAYYDNGYIQPISFFGDGTRVPLMVISPWTKPGYISHTYNDHVSIVKFIESNWGLSTLTSRSFDNLPNPIMSKKNPYVPLNRPAIGNLMTLFDFSHPQSNPPCIPLFGPTGPSAYPQAGNLPAIPASCSLAKNSKATSLPIKLRRYGMGQKIFVPKKNHQSSVWQNNKK